MTKPSRAPEALQRWILLTATACAEAQHRLDRSLLGNLPNGNPEAQDRPKPNWPKLSAEMGLELPLKRQVIQRMEMKLQGRWTKSSTVGFRVEAGGRWRENFVGLAYEQKTTRRSTTTTSVTIHIETVPLAPPQPTTSKATPKDLPTNSTMTVP